MKVNLTRILFLIIFILSIAMIIFIGLWRYKAIKLDNTCKLLSEAEANIEILKQDNERLLEYNQLKDEEIKNIEKEYMEQLNNIPVDTCGDAKPSKELLNYLKRNA